MEPNEIAFLNENITRYSTCVNAIERFRDTMVASLEKQLKPVLKGLETEKAVPYRKGSKEIWAESRHLKSKYVYNLSLGVYFDGGGMEPVGYFELHGAGESVVPELLREHAEAVGLKVRPNGARKFYITFDDAKRVTDMAALEKHNVQIISVMRKVMEKLGS